MAKEMSKKEQEAYIASIKKLKKVGTFKLIEDGLIKLLASLGTWALVIGIFSLLASFGIWAVRLLFKTIGW